MRLPWAHVVKHLEIAVLDHQGFAVLIEKEPHLRRSGRISEKACIRHDLFEVEEFNRLQRPPYFLPASREVWTIQHVDQSSFQVRNPQLLAGSFRNRNTEMFFSKMEKRLTKLRPPENVRSECQSPEGAGCRVGEVCMNRVSLSVELKCGVVRQYRIRRQLRGYEERVDRI